MRRPSSWRLPSLAAWAKLQIDNSLGAVSGIHQITAEMIASMKQVGIMYQGLSILGGGSILAGIVLGAATIYIIDRKFMKAAGFAAAGSVLTFFGLMHGEEVGLFENPWVVCAYLVVAAVLYACGRFSKDPVMGAEAAEASELEPLTEDAKLAPAAGAVA